MQKKTFETGYLKQSRFYWKTKIVLFTKEKKQNEIFALNNFLADFPTIML